MLSLFIVSHIQRRRSLEKRPSHRESVDLNQQTGDNHIASKQQQQQQQQQPQPMIEPDLLGAEEEARYLQELVAKSNDAKQANAVKQKVAEFARVKEELLRSKRAVLVLTGTDAEKVNLLQRP